jgi:hypothetical protein
MHPSPSSCGWIYTTRQFTIMQRGKKEEEKLPNFLIFVLHNAPLLVPLSL